MVRFIEICVMLPEVEFEQRRHPLFVSLDCSYQYIYGTYQQHRAIFGLQAVA